MPINRRDLLRLLGALGASAAVGCSTNEIVNPVPPPFFSDAERSALGALADAILPPDDKPGGAAIGAAQYIERLLTTFDGPSPSIYAGGPYSGRQPFSDGAGNAGSTFPPNDFASFLPMDRVTELAARVLLYGSSAVPGGSFNDHVLGPIVGLRDRVKAIIAEAMTAAPVPLATLDPAALEEAFFFLETDKRELLIELVAEAAFSAPEYGGNINLAGWKLIHFEGDAQPLGYSIFDESTNTYRERADAPVSTANPGADPEPMTQTSKDFLTNVAMLAGGKVFP